MPRDVKTVLDRDRSPSHPPILLAPPPTKTSAIRKAPLMLYDPYSQQMIVCTKPSSANPDLHAVPDAASGPSKAVRVLQLALLSSVAVMIWFMLSILQTTG